MPCVIDVTDWAKDDYHAIFPVGARDKAMLWSPELSEHAELKPKWPYLFKESIYRYPDQYWTELVAYIVSKYLGVDVPKVFPAIERTEHGTVCGSLIEWFYDVKTERFVHAGTYFKRLIPDFDDKTGKQHNLEDMATFLRFLSMHLSLRTDRAKWIADMALFDALIGNTDRHQENWGVVFLSDNTTRLSPLFDNGTALGHERFIKNIQGWSEEQLIRYIAKGRHHLRISRGDHKSRIPHFMLVKAVCNNSPEDKKYISDKINTLNLVDMFAEIDALTHIEIEVPFSKARCDWVKRNIELRLALIKEALT